MALNPNIFVYGLGVDDVKGTFHTTIDLHHDYPERVFDMPTSENAMLGVGLGASLNGMVPVMTHQRLDFFLLAMDQLVNNIAKWKFMFGTSRPTPMVIRLIIGRGWGQGPTHSQSLQSWFAHVPGLKVVMPTFPDAISGLLRTALRGEDPVLFLEHRWLYDLQGEMNEPLLMGRARVAKTGTKLTIVSLSYMTLEALRADIDADVIDLQSIRPLDMETVFKSVLKTGRLLVLDPANPVCSVSSEIISRVSMEGLPLKTTPRRLTFPDSPCPTSYELSKNYYTTTNDVIRTYNEMCNENKPLVAERVPHDVPGDWFRGPF